MSRTKKPGFDPVFEVMMGGILTQNTSWKNVEQAIGALYDVAALDAESVLALPHARLAQLITPARYFNQKATNLHALARHVVENYAGDARAMITTIDRAMLLRLRGIGSETADSMLCYAGGRLEFVIDVYTKRLCAQHGVVFPKYDDYKRFFEDQLPKQYNVYNEYHALIVAWGQAQQKKTPAGAGRRG